MSDVKTGDEGLAEGKAIEELVEGKVVTSGKIAEKASAGKAATEIAYCPHLGVYHYRRVDGTEFLFDEVQLEAAVEGYLKNGDAKLAEFMSLLTGIARQYAHQVVSFDEDGNLDLKELEEKKVVVEAEVVESGRGGE